jgi:outer membrane translocation and assembly module TamA
VERERFGAQRLHLIGSYGLALDASTISAMRVSLGLDWRKEAFHPLAGQPVSTLPLDREFRYVFVQYETVLPDYLTWNYIDHDDRVEDVALGPRLLVKLGISPAAFGVDRTTGLVEAAGEAGFRIGANAFLRGRAAFDARVATTLEDAHFQGDVWFVRRFQTSLRQTFVAHVGAFHGWNLDADEQFFMDGTTGLRGYRLRSFEGDQRVVLNLEQRFYSGWQIAGLVSPGFAVFFDAGTMGGPGSARPMQLSQVKMDVGVGLRFALAWAPVNNVFRIDAAYALQPDPHGRKGWLISFSSGQAF